MSYYKYLLAITILTFCFKANSQVNPSKVKVEMKVTVRKAPDPVKPLDFNKMSQELSKSINNNTIAKEERIAAREKFYFECLNFVSSFVCSGANLSFNQKIVQGQDNAKKGVEEIYTELTSGWLDPTEYYFSLNTCINNYKDFIIKCDLINQSYEVKLNSYIQKNDSNFVIDLDKIFGRYMEQINIDYNIEWNEKNKNFNTINTQTFNFRKTNIKGKVTFLTLIEFYNESINFLKEYPNILKVDENESDNSNKISKENYDLEKYIDYYLIARSKHDSLDYYGAIEYFEKIIEIKPTDTVFLLIAREHYILKNFQEVIISAHKALAMNKSSHYSFFWIAKSHEGLNQNELALENYNKCISMNAYNYTYYENRAELKIILMDNKGALEDYKAALKLRPNDIFIQEKIKLLKKKV